MLQKDCQGISVLEALAATGLRAIRYAQEVAGIGQVVANDMDADAVKSMRRNVDFNGVGSIVTPHQADARLVMLQHSQVRIAAYTTALVSHAHLIIQCCAKTMYG